MLAPLTELPPVSARRRFPFREVPRSPCGWIQKGRELDPAAVNFCRTFKAPQVTERAPTRVS